MHSEITRNYRNLQGTPAPNSSSRPFRRLRARTHAAALAAIRIGARAAAALVTAGVPLGAPHMRTTQLVAHNGALQCNANRLRCPVNEGTRKPRSDARLTSHTFFESHRLEDLEVLERRLAKLAVGFNCEGDEVRCARMKAETASEVKQM